MQCGCNCAGSGLPELLLALLVFSVGILALLHNQLLGSRLAHDALQRSSATALARDLITRIQSNPGRVDDYRLDLPAGIAGQLQAPEADCAGQVCSTAQMAAFESWQWLRLLRGQPVVLTEDERSGDGGALREASVPALRAPAVCVHFANTVATVAVGWVARQSGVATAEFRCRDGDIVALEGGSRPPGLFSLKLHAWVGGQ